MADFALVALPGAYHSSVGALMDTFLLARERVERVFAGSVGLRMETRLRVISPDGAPVAMADGRMLAVDGSLDSTADYDFIWLPAFRAEGAAALERRLARTLSLQAWLGRQHARGALIGASGAAAALPIAARLTADQPVPVARALRPVVRALFPRQPIEERQGVSARDGLLLSGGLAGDLALILRAMERLLSPDIARWVASVIGPDGAEAALAEADPLVASAQLWLEQRFAGPIEMTDLAATLATSAATLNRRFRHALGMSPGSYVRQLRLDAACRMLEMTDRPIDGIAQAIGYSDSRLFRTMFRQRTGLSASGWRARARARAG